MRLLQGVLALILVATVAAGCKGPAGAMGPEGAMGPAGQTGQPGAPGKAGTGGMPPTCLVPCHTVGGILPLWRTSKHALMSSRQAGGEPTSVLNWSAPGFACGNCHAIDALEQRSAGNVVTAGGKPPNLQKGQLFYLGAGKLVEATYAATEDLAINHCTTCHKLTVDPHQTGEDYKAGSFATYWVPAGVADEAMLEKSPVAGSVTGTPAGKFQAGNTCVWCHRARRDATNGITAQNLLTNHFWGPHGSCQADIVSGKGAYHFGGQSYTTIHAHTTVSKGCVACHMPQVSENHLYADHSFRPRLGPCKTCHAGLTSFNYKDGQTTVKKGLAELQAALNTAGYLTRGTAASDNDPLSTAELADGLYFKDNVRVAAPPKSITEEWAGALYDYFLVARGGASGVHQPVYTKQLLWDAITVVKGATPSFIPARP